MNTGNLYNRIMHKQTKYDDLSALLGAVKSDDYCCPKCGKQEDECEGEYEVDGENYPKYFNESRGSTMNGNYWDWDEVHHCTGCGTKYWFRNGII